MFRNLRRLAVLVGMTCAVSSGSAFSQPPIEDPDALGPVPPPPDPAPPPDGPPDGREAGPDETTSDLEAEGIAIPDVPVEGPTVEVPDPALHEAADIHRGLVGDTVVSPAFQDALREEDRALAIEAAAEGRTPTVACIEALLFEQALREVWVPETVDVGALGTRVLESVAPAVVEAIEPLRIAYARCLSTIEDAGRELGTLTETFRERAALLETARARGLGPDLILAHPTLREAVDDEAIDVSWDSLRRMYFDRHGTIREGEQDKRTPGWRVTALLTSTLVFMGSLLGIPVSLRAQGGDRRLRLGLLGVALGSFGGVFLGPTWTDPTSPKTVNLLVLGALLTAGAAVSGLALLLTDVARRFEVMGTGMLIGAAGNLAWLLGGIVLHQRSLPFRHGRPSVEISRRGGSIGWTGFF